jgi:hypothetical protein
VDHACSADHESDEEQERQEDNPVLPEVPVLPAATPGTAIADDDKQIRVSVYWYTRSLKKNKGQS